MRYVLFGLPHGEPHWRPIRCEPDTYEDCRYVGDGLVRHGFLDTFCIAKRLEEEKTNA